jgi:hypothetical protein
MSAPNRCPWVSVAESDVVEWYGAGWHYVGPDATDDNLCIMEWRSDKPPVRPFSQTEAELQYIARAVSALEGRAA